MNAAVKDKERIESKGIPSHPKGHASIDIRGGRKPICMEEQSTKDLPSMQSDIIASSYPSGI
tara:strand:+ start:527 stop:712 length:186 start_codon:yes stop_codon:yes gene_type:complete